MHLFLLRAGEYMLKKGTRPLFEKQLRENLKRTVKAHCSSIVMRDGRIYLYHYQEKEALVANILEKTFGISDYHLAIAGDLNMESLQQSITELIPSELKQQAISFKVDVNRANKSFSVNSYDTACILGGWTLDHYPSWSVNVQKPQVIIKVELREKAYVYLVWQNESKGAGGLPVGSAGRGVLMLSGGIDSPVAGYLMNKRGLQLSAVHFHTPPYTSAEALDKVEHLAKTIAPWNGGRIVLYTVNFTPIQLAINKLPKPEFATIVGRIMMMHVVDTIMQERGAKALVTGEALSQVASQTLESLQVTTACVPMLILRPCISMDKQEIIQIAKKITTFNTSIIPATDCCSLFAPNHPSTRPKIDEVQELVDLLDTKELIEETLKTIEQKVFYS